MAICTDCGADRKVLKSMMTEMPEIIDGAWLESENRTMAKHIISGCESCKEWYNKEVKK